VAICASLTMPVLTTMAPQWTIAVLPAAPVASVAVDSEPAAPVVANVADPVFDPIPATTPSSESTETASYTQTAQTVSVFDNLPITATIWLAGVLLVLARLAFGTARVWWIARRAAPATMWAPLGARLARSLGIERPVTFLSGDEDAMPMACGLLRARVLLPAEADDWPIERQRVVLLHELAHVKRRDCLTQMLAHMACAVYWFNPLVWLAARRLRAERERACDDLVLAAGTRGSDYADHLLDIARSLRGAWPTWSAVTMAHRSQLEGRLMAILDPALPRRSPTRRSVAVFAGLSIIVIVSLAVVRPVAKAADASEQGRPSALAAPAPAPAPAPLPPPAPEPAPAPFIVPPAPPLVAQVPAPPAPAPRATRISPPIVIAPIPAPFIDATIEQAVNAAVAQVAVQPPQPVQRSQAQADPKITAALTGALKDEDEDVRRHALNALVRMRAPLPPDVLAGMLKDKSPEVRRQAISAIGNLRDAKYVSLIVDAMKDADADVRRQASAALGQMRDPRAVDPLIAALKDADPEVRRQAAAALGQLRDARATDALIAALKDANADVRRQAVFALGQIR
jgi:beta-lactamase regulating signal transducer with metallopeptidase domain